MLLEAGKGNAMIPNKAYTLRGLRGQTTEAGKLLFNNVVDERIRVANTIMLMDRVVSNWTDHLYSQYSDCVSQLAAYRNSVIVEPEAEKFVSRCFTDDAFDGDVLKFEDGTDAATKERCRQIASSLFDSYKAMFNYCKEIKTGKKDIPDDNDRMCTKALKKILAANCLKEVDDILEFKDKLTLEAKRFLFAGSTFKRMVAFFLIKETKGVEPTINTYFSSLESFNNANAWADYVASLEKWTGKSVAGKMGAVTRFAKEAFDAARDMARNNFSYFRAYSDRKAWSNYQNGEILISDKEGSETLNFENGGLNHKTNEDGFTEQIKSLLTKL